MKITELITINNTTTLNQTINKLLLTTEVALFISCIIIVLELVGVFDYILYKLKLHKPFNCPFCMSFHLSVHYNLLVVLLFNQPSNLLTIPFTCLFYYTFSKLIKKI